MPGSIPVWAFIYQRRTSKETRPQRERDMCPQALSFLSNQWPSFDPQVDFSPWKIIIFRKTVWFERVSNLQCRVQSLQGSHGETCRMDRRLSMRLDDRDDGPLTDRRPIAILLMNGRKKARERMRCRWDLEGGEWILKRDLMGFRFCFPHIISLLFSSTHPS